MYAYVLWIFLLFSHAEILTHPPYGEANGMPYFANLRGAKATDTYILKGDTAGEVRGHPILM